MSSDPRLTLICAALCGVAACSTPGSAPASADAPVPVASGGVTFQMDAFRASQTAGTQWVAYTDRGFEFDGTLVVAAGEGCLKEDASPQVILPIPGESTGYWLYGTTPSLSGDDTIAIDCLVRLDGTTEPGAGVAARVDEKPRPSDNFGTDPVPWRQKNQSPIVSTVTPLGVVEWVLSVDRQICWLTGSKDGAWSACLPTGDHSGFEVKKWVITPEGLRNSSVRTVPLAAVPTGDAKVWLHESGRAAVAIDKGASSTLWVYGNPDEQPEGWTAGPIEVGGTVTGAVFDGPELRALSVDFDEQVYRLHTIVGGKLQTQELPEKMRPTRLHLSPNGALWGAELGKAWLLDGK